jgi:hypothetical protein
MITNDTKLDEQNLDFLNDLRKLDKEELVDLIYEFWTTLKLNAENGMNDNVNYMMEEFGRVKMTQVNRLKILAKFKSDNIYFKLKK